MSGNRVRRVLGKLRGRSVREMRVRGTQALTSWIERSSVAVAPPSSAPLDAAALVRRLVRDPHAPRDAASLAAHFRREPAAAAAWRARPPFFAGVADPDATVAAIRRLAPAHEGELVACAERALAGRFDVLGFRELSYGDPVDWHLDPVSGRRAPASLHWSAVPYLTPGVVGDHKVVWEVNRHGHVVLLAQAYRFTRDERYARAAVAHVDAWIAANPPGLGMNWASSLEVAFRAIAWLWALELLRDSPSLEAAFVVRALNVLYLHGRHLQRYLSTYFSPNTHLTGEALGLFYLGTMLPELRRAAAWRERGREILVSELGRQIRNDGVYFEQATYYQRYTADFYLHAILLARAQSHPLPDDAVATAERVVDHLLAVMRPDGRIPLVGDDDGGRLLSLDTSHTADVRPTLAAAAGVFGRGDYRAAAGAGNEAAALWLLGADAVAGVTAVAPAGRGEVASRGFPDGGYFVMRDVAAAAGGAAARGANYAIVDCGPHGWMNGGHAHADALAIELSARGRAALVDPGTYTYVGEERDAFRGSAAHNTVLVDGESQSVPDRPFTWRTSARATLRAWAATPRFDFFEGEHDGYRRLHAPATHVRSVLFVKGDDDARAHYWVVRDRVFSAGAHDVSVRFQADAGLAATLEGDARAATLADDANGELVLRVASFGAGGRLSVDDDGWVSPAFGSRARAPRLRYDAHVAGEAEVVTFLLPASRVTAGPVPGVYQVDGDGWTDTVAVGPKAAAARSAELSADGADWLWTRRAARDVRASQCLAVGASRLCERDETIAEGAPGAWLYARRDGHDTAAAAGAWVTTSGPLTPARHDGVGRNPESRRG